MSLISLGLLMRAAARLFFCGLYIAVLFTGEQVGNGFHQHAVKHGSEKDSYIIASCEFMENFRSVFKG